MSDTLTFVDAQKIYADWISQFPEGYWSDEKILAQLVEEVGEVAEWVLKQHPNGHEGLDYLRWKIFIEDVIELSKRARILLGKPTKNRGGTPDDLKSELADILIPILSFSNKKEFSLGEAVKQMFEKKLFGRDNDRFKRKDEESGR